MWPGQQDRGDKLQRRAEAVPLAASQVAFSLQHETCQVISERLVKFEVLGLTEFGSLSSMHSAV